MKRDWDLVRALLLAAEDVEATGMSPDVSIEPWTSHEIHDHSTLLEQAGFLRASYAMGPSTSLLGLTWKGHEFLDSIRDEDVWAKLKGEVAAKGGSATLDILKTLGAAILKKKFGLPDG